MAKAEWPPPSCPQPPHDSCARADSEGGGGRGSTSRGPSLSWAPGALWKQAGPREQVCSCCGRGHGHHTRNDTCSGHKTWTVPVITSTVTRTATASIASSLCQRPPRGEGELQMLRQCGSWTLATKRTPVLCPKNKKPVSASTRKLQIKSLISETEFTIYKYTKTVNANLD